MRTFKRLAALAALLFAILGSAGGTAGADAICARFSTQIPFELQVMACPDLP